MGARDGVISVPGTIPGKAGSQVGGLVGQQIKNIDAIGVDTGRLEGISDDLRSRANFANPLIGQGQQALSGVIGSGNPVDVSGITEAANSEANRTFERLSGGINQNLGALNLGSSSARNRALADAAGDVSARVGEAGLRANVGAQENARNRQLSGLGLLESARAGDRSALTGAGNLEGQARGLELQGETAKAGAGQSLINPLQNQFRGTSATVQGGRVGGGAVPVLRNRGGTFAGIRRFQDGGRVNERDFLSNLLFGQNFDAPVQPAALRAIPRQSGPIAGSQRFLPSSPARRAVPDEDPRIAFEREKMNRARLDAQLNRHAESIRAGDMANALLNSSRAFRSPGDVTRLSRQINAIGIPAATQGLAQSGRLLGAQDGGTIDGPKDPPDMVPATGPNGEDIRVTGGEVIVPEDVVTMMLKAKGPEQMKLAMEMFKDVTKRKPKETFAQGGQTGASGTPAYQRGGAVRSFTNEDLESVGNSLPGQLVSDPTSQADLEASRLGLLTALAARGPRGAEIAQANSPTLSRQAAALDRALLAEQTETEAQRVQTLDEIRSINEQRRAAAEESRAQAEMEKRGQQRQKELDRNNAEAAKMIGRDDGLGGQITPEQARQIANERAVFRGLKTQEEVDAEEAQIQAEEQAQAQAQEFQLESERLLQVENQIQQGRPLSPEDASMLAQRVLRIQELNPEITDEQFAQQFPQIFTALSQIMSQGG